MSDLTWFRHYSDAHQNFKLRRLEDHTQLFYWWILELHAQGKYNPDDTASIAESLFVEERRVVDEIAALKSGQLLRSDGSIKGWADRQYESDKSAPRVRRHREKVKGNVSATPRNGDETLRNVTTRYGIAPETETETETEQKQRTSPSSTPDGIEPQSRGGTPNARTRVQSAPRRHAGVAMHRFPLDLDPSNPEIGEDFWPPVDTLSSPTGNQLGFLHKLTEEAGKKLGRRVTVAEAAVATSTGTLSAATFTAIKDHLKAMTRASPGSHPRDVSEFNRRSLEEYIGSGGNGDEN